MSQSPEQAAFLRALRQVMKNKRITYAQAAAELGVSEQTIKRLFAGDADCPFDRLVALCGVAGVRFQELAELAADPSEETFQLSAEQEQALVDQSGVYGFFSRLRDEKTVAQIAADEGLSARSVAYYLRELDRLGLVERLEGETCRMLVRGGHNLRVGGPLQEKYLQVLLDNFHAHLRHPLVKDQVLQTFSDGELSRDGLRELIAELEEVTGRYRRRAQRERALLKADELIPVSWFVGVVGPIKIDRMEAVPNV